MRSKWHSMDKLLYVWVVSKYCEQRNKNLLNLDVTKFMNLESRFQGV